MRILFIHRSVGRHLLKYGNLRKLLNGHDIRLDDYNNNDGTLTYDDGKSVENIIRMPGNNTNPDNLADFFKSWPDVLNGYDLMMIKSCYPNSHIKNKAQLDKVKQSYSSIIKSFKERNKKLFILTTPPLRPLFTNPTEAKLSSNLADWLMDQLKTNAFDMHHYYSEVSGRNKGMLKPEYRRLTPWDNHPNRKAHKSAAPKIVSTLTQKTL
jgi:hypothetical protein